VGPELTFKPIYSALSARKTRTAVHNYSLLFIIYTQRCTFCVVDFREVDSYLNVLNLAATE